ncbi:MULTISPECIES: hypothetical protein [unclassified Calothrix]|uniref:hypothetical protein n=1 Tax=unclassified Calothrix TaxID=2619626 RepID=UPI0018EF7E95|nr:MULTISPECIES: hypothetical protein [unclassified Calothrix]
MQTKYLASLLTLGLTLTTVPVMSSPVQETITPNLYELQSPLIKVIYSKGSLVGKPYLNYRDRKQTLNFSGDQIRTTETEIGTLVTVTITKTVDTGSVTFSLLLPAVNLGTSKQAKIETKGITTVNLFSTIPAFKQGQRQTYTVTPLVGTAKYVAF